MSANTLLISVSTLKERTHIHDNIDEKMIFPDIKYVQDTYIHPVLGTALFRKMQELIEADATLATAGVYKTLLETYIIDAICYFTLAEMVLSGSFHFTNKGVVRRTSDTSDPVPMSEIFDLANRYKNRGETYANRMKEYLRATATTSVLPEYLNPGTTSDTILPEQNAFTLPITLDEDCNPWCNPGGFNGKPYE
jgi:hypothetical protein